MGIGIAHAFASSGWQTYLVEPALNRQVAALELIAEVTTEGVRRGKVTEKGAATVRASVHLVEDLEAVPKGCALIVESVPEHLDLKRKVLTAAEAREPHILATNTSALSIDELAIGLRRPGRFLGTHFFNPVWSLPLVEVVKGASTDDDTLKATLDLVQAIGKEAAVVRNSPGFATSRLDLVASLEAMRMVEQGVASPADIDRAMVTAYRHPVGPLRLADIVGLDVRLDIARGLHATLGARFEPPALLVSMVERGDLGAKSGRGFYEWPGA
jgi:3-hydroxybutyryl-CoA dehydrogenase